MPFGCSLQFFCSVFVIYYCSTQKIGFLSRKSTLKKLIQTEVMKPLQTPQKIFVLFCVYPADEVGWKKLACGIFTMALIVSNICGFLSSAVFFLNYVSVDLEISLYALFTVFGFLISIYADVFVFFSRHKIYNVFTKLSDIYETSKNLA